MTNAMTLVCREQQDLSPGAAVESMKDTRTISPTTIAAGLGGGIFVQSFLYCGESGQDAPQLVQAVVMRRETGPALIALPADNEAHGPGFSADYVREELGFGEEARQVLAVLDRLENLKSQERLATDGKDPTTGRAFHDDEMTTDDRGSKWLETIDKSQEEERGNIEVLEEDHGAQLVRVLKSDYGAISGSEASAFMRAARVSEAGTGGQVSGWRRSSNGAALKPV